MARVGGWLGGGARIGVVAGGAAVIALVAPDAWALHPGLHPRTPVEWRDTACIEVVDRSSDSIYAFDYEIPYEDTAITEGEVPDSRTHQFFAFCRQRLPIEFLPGWITEADVATATDYGLVDIPVTDEQILELDEAWAGCWHRITEDDERRPITWESSEQPVIWDTASVPSGTYVISGYTHEPPFNLWSPRNGNIVTIVDDSDAARGPAAVMTGEGQEVCIGEALHVEGCVDARPGSTITLSYATAPNRPSEDPAQRWIVIEESLPVEGDTFSFEWLPPEQVGGHLVMIRAAVADPDGGRYIAYHHHLHIVRPQQAEPCTSSENTGGDSSRPASPDASSSTAGDTAKSGVDEEEAGCSCTSQPRRPLLPLILLVPSLCVRRRR